jgi:hypothetical protein
MTPSALTRSEEQIFDSLANNRHDSTFKGVLYRDGVPSPKDYLAQRVRVLFVFREPNLGNEPYDLDMRAQIRDLEFRAIRDGKFGSPGTLRGWWNYKVGGLAHAAVCALSGGSPAKSLGSFHRLIKNGQRLHEFLFPFAFVQIKKTGGGGASNPDDIERHARMYRQCLRTQVRLYDPHLIIGCGLPPASPARLLNQYVLPPAEERKTADERFTWWQYPDSARPLAMLEFNHPSFRGPRDPKYFALISALREISTASGLPYLATP